MAFLKEISSGKWSKNQCLFSTEGNGSIIYPGIVNRTKFQSNSNELNPGAGQNTLRRLAFFLYLNHPTTNDVTSGQKSARRSFLQSSKVKFRSSVIFSYL